MRISSSIRPKINGKQTFKNNDSVNQDSPLYLLFQHKGSKGKREYGKSEEE